MDGTRSTEERLRELVRANARMSSELDLQLVLRRAVEIAMELSGARYGAMGVIGPSGQTLERFIYVGMSEADAVRIGHLPEGHGLLGAIIEDPQPIRIDDIGTDARSIGFPAGHPPMHEFLGVPVRSRELVFGNLYLAERPGGFTEEDEDIVTSVAGAAGLAIDNARLFGETVRRQAWAAAAVAVTGAIVGGSREEATRIVVERARELAGAESVEFTADAVLLDGPFVMSFPLQDAEPGAADASAASGASGVSGSSGRSAPRALRIARTAGSAPFSPAEREMAGEFAERLRLALQLADAQDARRSLDLLEDRSRIARDLHDHVIQQLFGAGLEVQSLIGSPLPASASDRLREVADNLDEAIGQIRLAIFAMTERPQGSASVRHRLLDVIDGFRASLPRPPRVEFHGAVDASVGDALSDDVVAVVRESLANIVRHAAARAVAVGVTADAADVVVEVADDGRGGVRPDGRRSGLANLEERALRRGGEFLVESDPSGTRLRWSAPLGS